MGKKFIFNLLAIIVPAIVLIIFLFIILFDYVIYNSFAVFPNPRYRYKVSFFSDIFWGGKSYVKKSKITNDKISFVYHLKKWDDYSIAGMSIDLTNQNKGFDLSKYKYLNIKLSSSEKSTYRIFLLSYIDEKSRKNNPSTLRHHRQNIILNKINESQSFKLKLNKFQMPEWWIKANDYKGQTILKKVSKDIVLLQLQNNDYIMNKDFHVTIKEIYFTKGFPFIYSILSIVLFLYLALYFVFNFYLKKILKSKGIIKYRNRNGVIPNIQT